ncbi:formate dehydrogenase subunit delta [Agrobacterium vitis]|nr:formate dehydrogenase subunit delta [Agrobacterium vitis]MBE1439903.1 formate dehydrogenase subunit delta [Agrobacterium vitis]
MSHDHIAEKLIRMANQIATFFKSQPENERLAGIATHINKFWEPRMRRQFFELIDANPEGRADGFDPLVIAAAKLINRPVDNTAKTFGLSGEARA